jgi:hypothetical protein
MRRVVGRPKELPLSREGLRAGVQAGVDVKFEEGAVRACDAVGVDGCRGITRDGFTTLRVART